MKKFISVILALSLLMLSAQAAVFSDTVGHWAENDIETIAELGAVNGYTDGTFAPDAPITRAEYAKIVGELFGLPTTENACMLFEDVERGDWYAPYVQDFFWLVMTAFIDDAPAVLGEDYGRSFGGQTPLTRVEAAAGLLAVCDAPGLTAEEKAGVLSRVADSAEFSDNASTNMVVSMAVNSGLMVGDDQGRFRPYDTISRAEVCTLLSRAVAKNGTAASKFITNFLNEEKAELDAKAAQLVSDFLSETKKNENDNIIVATVNGEEISAGDFTAFLLMAFPMNLPGGLFFLIGSDLNFDQPYTDSDSEYSGMTKGDVFIDMILDEIGIFAVLRQTAREYGLVDEELLLAAAESSYDFKTEYGDKLTRSLGLSDYAIDKLMLDIMIPDDMDNYFYESELSEEEIIEIIQSIMEKGSDIQRLDNGLLNEILKAIYE